MARLIHAHMKPYRRDYKSFFRVDVDRFLKRVSHYLKENGGYIVDESKKEENTASILIVDTSLTYELPVPKTKHLGTAEIKTHWREKNSSVGLVEGRILLSGPKKLWDKNSQTVKDLKNIFEKSRMEISYDGMVVR